MKFVEIEKVDYGPDGRYTPSPNRLYVNVNHILYFSQESSGEHGSARYSVRMANGYKYTVSPRCYYNLKRKMLPTGRNEDGMHDCSSQITGMEE